MTNEAASAGVLDTPFGKFARLQILTIEDLFAGKKPAMPPEDPTAFRRAAREEDKTRAGKADLAKLTPLPDRLGQLKGTVPFSCPGASLRKGEGAEGMAARALAT